MREGFLVLEKEVARKFPSFDNVVGSMLFLRFISPTILQPHMYEISDEPSNPASLRALVLICKIMQAIINKSQVVLPDASDDINEQIHRFMISHSKPMVSFCRRLTVRYCITIV
jgi:hypothetical protein